MKQVQLFLWILLMKGLYILLKSKQTVKQAKTFLSQSSLWYSNVYVGCYKLATNHPKSC